MKIFKIQFILVILFCGQMHLLDAANKNKIYLQLYSLRTDITKDFGGTLDKVEEIGFKGIEAASYADGKFYNLSPVAFKQELLKRKLSILSSHIGKNIQKNMTPADWKSTWEWWDTAIEAHKLAGFKYIVVPSMPKVSTLAELKTYCDYFNQIGEKCNQAGLHFGYHNHSFEFENIEGELIYDYLLNNTKPQKVFFEMDVYWVNVGKKNPIEYFKEYPGRFELLHIKDSKELGSSGLIDFKSILDSRQEAGTKQIIIEVENYSYEPIRSVEISFDYLNQLLK